LAGGRERFHPLPQDHARLLACFLSAAVSGDLTTLNRLLAEDVTKWSDGGCRTVGRGAGHRLDATAEPQVRGGVPPI
jgi:hypothetical protein